MTCIYLRHPRPQALADGRTVHGCDIHELCTPQPHADGTANPYAACPLCRDSLPADSRDLAARYRDPLAVYTADKRPTDALRGMLKGGVAFLVCGGPSAKQLPLEQLQQPGCWSLAVNNMAAYYRPNAFVCSDPPSKFHEGIWRDPNIMKFVPEVKLHDRRGKLRRKQPDGSFADLKLTDEVATTQTVPNVWGFGRRSWFKPDDTFFTDPHAAWGNNDDGVRRTRGKKTVCTPLLGLRILYYLGARRVYLVGVDFYMDPAAGLHDNYAFKEERDKGACESNNAQYAVVNEWLCLMQQNDVFSKFGLEVYNTNEASGLRAFAHVPFDVAVADAWRDWPSGPPYDCKSWYHKPPRK